MNPRTKLKNIERNTKISSTREGKIHSVSQLIKITKHAKKREHMTHNEENYQSIEKDPEMTQVIELVDKHTKILIKIYYIHKKEKNMSTTGKT